MLKGEDDNKNPSSVSAADRVALYLPPVAAPQHWRSGIYERVENGDGESAPCYRRLERANGSKTKSAVGESDPPPASFLYKVPEKKMWLVGSTPGATTGAAVVYDDAKRPEDVEGVWCVFDGTNWAKALEVGVAKVAYDGGERRYGVVEPAKTLDLGLKTGVLAPPTGSLAPRGGGAAPAAGAPGATAANLRDDDLSPPKPPPDGVVLGTTGDGAAAKGKEPPVGDRRLGPDHARLASIVLAALEAHEPYRRVFWAAVAAAATREPPMRGDAGDGSAARALAAGARAVGTTTVAASLVAERMISTPQHLADARKVVQHAKAESVAALDAHGKDAVVLSIPGAEGVQSWRAGLYAKLAKGDPALAGTAPHLLYKRVRDRPSEQDSFLYTLPDRGMWLVGSSPGSTTGGLVAYDKAKNLRDLHAPWHVFDGKAWTQAPGIAVTLVADVQGPTSK